MFRGLPTWAFTAGVDLERTDRSYQPEPGIQGVVGEARGVEAFEPEENAKGRCVWVERAHRVSGDLRTEGPFDKTVSRPPIAIKIASAWHERRRLEIRVKVALKDGSRLSGVRGKGCSAGFGQSIGSRNGDGTGGGKDHQDRTAEADPLPPCRI